MREKRLTWAEIDRLVQRLYCNDMEWFDAFSQKAKAAGQSPEAAFAQLSPRLRVRVWALLWGDLLRFIDTDGCFYNAQGKAVHFWPHSFSDGSPITTAAADEAIQWAVSPNLVRWALRQVIKTPKRWVVPGLKSVRTEQSKR